MNTNYMVDTLEVPLQAALTLHVLLAMAGFVAVAYGAIRSVRRKRGDGIRSLVLGNIGILGLFACMYGINRPTVGGILLGLPFIIIALYGLYSDISEDGCSLSAEGLQYITGSLGGSLEVLRSGILCFLVVFVCGFAAALPEKIEAQIPYYGDSFYALADDVSEVIEPETKGIGIGAVEVFAQLGRDTGVHIMDTPDMAFSQNGVTDFSRKLARLSKDSVLVSIETLRNAEEGDLQEFVDTHYQTMGWRDGTMDLTYWKPKNR